MTSRSFLGRGSAIALFATIVAAAAGGGCKGSSDSSDNGTSQDDQRAEAHDFYVQHVHNALTSCINCHGGTADPTAPQFMAALADDSYSLMEKSAGLIAAPKNSPLVQYVHQNPLIGVSPEQRAILTTWLSLEATARNLEGAVAKAKTIKDAYDDFAKCMNRDVWLFYRMGDLGFTQTDSEGPCLGCHSTGQGSAFLSADSALTFEKAQQFPYIQKLVVGKLNEKGSFESLVPSNRLIEKAEEICPPGSTSCHPRFGLPPNISKAIEAFVQTTLENMTSGTCQTFVAPIDAGPKDAGDGG
jgi:mono/diheme cytochrome c family protein